ncbi:UDP-forming cellulose synthase catalytic subunit [Acetobacter sp. TBRC 12305]|uniref:UDP-forming cellulose synthase catalytic subunit n=1 Tax=Acetobacter garciniae TaxID=2817435 RepID=UPI001C7350E7|nr:UDP-forming cellulose synthase catalytic subunit [Acetobacter garciniae]MBX0345075.1 UDP-forming cellulose synthase catalytic subunit [Acetobacter garciniae]
MRSTPQRPTKALPYALIIIGTVLILVASQAVITPVAQIYLSIVVLFCAIAIRNRPGHLAGLIMIGLSTFVSLRYIFWRLTNTLAFENWLQTTLTLLLLFAEIYSWAILFLGYMQLAWPLNRKEFPLPEDTGLWPSVDVFIPTYNEDLSVVRNTVLAAMAMDWPADKLRVYLLDDGRRPSFEVFAREVGVGYITRPNNAHAKAGNLNHALTKTSGELVAVFDCDHVPVKSFLTRTLGWMVQNPRISLIQTPQHFYSLDPFQRNLDTYGRIPPESNLFYGLVQPGNDFWNATLFCGSCAVLRRAALESIKGFAVETVTEDAHTSLKMQRKGWESAYLRETLAGGLATESLALHVGQRIRWARGMVQIFRIDNPLLGRGLSLGQRLCYLSAMLHFFFPIPRLIFLIAPLAFLFLGQNVIFATPVAVMTYAIPHLVQSLMTQSRMQGRWRYSIWNYVYETSIAIFLAPVVMMALIAPSRGTFNVTAKGGLISHNYLDTRMVRPNVIMCFILIVAAIVGVGGMILHRGDTSLFQTYGMNLLWVLANLLIVLAAITVGYERKQIRRAPRIPAQLSVNVLAPDGAQRYAGQTLDLSKGGLSLRMQDPLPAGLQTVHVEYVNQKDKIITNVPASIINQQDNIVRLEWRSRDIRDETEIVEMIFGRSDAWSHWSDYSNDKPLHSLNLLARGIANFIVVVVLRRRPLR